MNGTHGALCLDPRTQQAVKAFALLENLAGPGYEAAPNQVGAIVDELGDAVDRLSAAFKGEKPAEREFKLPNATVMRPANGALGEWPPPP